MKLLFTYLKKYKYSMTISVILVSVSSMTALVLPMILKKVINEGILAPTGPDQVLMQDLGLIMIVVALVGLVTGVINTFFSARLSQNAGADLRASAFERIQSYSYQDIEKFKPTNLVVRLTNDINQIQMAIGMMFSTLLRMPILFVGSFVLAIITIPEFWYVVVILMVLVTTVMVIVVSRAIPRFGKAQKQIDAINSSIKENFEGARVVKSFVTEDKEELKFKNLSDDLAENTKRIGYIFAIVMPAFILIANLATLYVVYAAADLAVAQPEVIGGVVTYMNYLMQLMMALIIGGMVMMQFSRAMVSMKRVSEILETTASIEYLVDGEEEIIGSIEFKNVSFVYPNEEGASLENISFKVDKGETVGIVGATGSGKSTLVHLMLRLFDVTKGEVLIDGKDIKTFKQSALRQKISIILQKPILFSGTINDNLVAGKHDLTEQVIQFAANNAQAAEFIERLPKKYESAVQQRGSNFSGGQKQRLSITRGLVGDPAIIVLDDSTSALDSRSEKLVKQSLFENYGDKTVFMIAQKITSVIDADKIIVLDDGKLDSIGTHRELLQTSSVYREIYETQKGRE